MSTSVLSLTALFLGVRHGVDFDHIAAIMDIVSSTPPGEAPTAASDTSGQWRSTLSTPSSPAFRLACLYAAGHALVVICLGLSALVFSIVLPEWIEPFMQKVVGATLLVFGFYVLYSLHQSCSGNRKFKMRSRWMLLIEGLNAARSKKPKDCRHEQPQPGCCGPRSSFGLGMLHGIGAETATQVLVLSAVAGSSPPAGVLLLALFVIGMFAANAAVAMLLSAGTASARIALPLTVAAGILTAALSICIGASFLSGSVGPRLSLPIHLDRL